MKFENLYIKTSEKAKEIVELFNKNWSKISDWIINQKKQLDYKLDARCQYKEEKKRQEWREYEEFLKKKYGYNVTGNIPPVNLEPKEEKEVYQSNPDDFKWYDQRVAATFSRLSGMSWEEIERAKNKISENELKKKKKNK